MSRTPDIPPVVDVVVVGSGVAGLCAAVESLEAGASVLVLEAADAVGGASVMSGAACCLVGTPLQEAAGISDSPELALADWIRTGGDTVDVEWARRYVTASRTEVHDWCERFGIRWVQLAQPEGNSAPRWHLPSGWGRGIVEALLVYARSLGARVATGTPVTAILDREGAVIGVRCRSVDGVVDVSAGAVVMATGGFVADPDMVLAAAPQLRDLPRLLHGGSPTATGAGHRLLRDAGAAFTCVDHIWVYPNGTPDPRDLKGVRGLGIRGIAGDVWLNARGERFHDETLNGARSGTRALLAQPEQTAWAVFSASEVPDLLLIDNEYFATPAGPHPDAMAEFWRESPFAWRADGPRELADAIGLPADALRDTLAEIDKARLAGLAREPRFGRDLARMRPLDGPLAAIQYFPMAQKNFGGVRTDLSCRVLAVDGEPIPGLFAAGEVAGMAGGHINGRAALEGTMFGPSLFSGRIAGAAAARSLAGVRK